MLRLVVSALALAGLLVLAAGVIDAVPLVFTAFGLLTLPVALGIGVAGLIAVLVKRAAGA